MNKTQDSFTVSIKGETSGENFAGKFTVKTKLSHGNQLMQDQIRRQLLGPQPVGVVPGDRATNTSEILSQLQVRIVSAPSWWTNSDNGLNLDDDNIIVEVFTKATAVEVEYKESIKTAAEEAKKKLAEEPVKVDE
jgi:hypothetical protein